MVLKLKMPDDLGLPINIPEQIPINSSPDMR